MAPKRCVSMSAQGQATNMNRTACAASNTPTEVAQDARHPAQSATCAVARHNVDGKQLKVRFDVPDREFSSVYLKSPEGNFASLNAGDYELYVGGLAINKAFGEALEACGQACGKKPKNRFKLLHEALLARAAARPGSLHRLRPGDLFRRPQDTGAVSQGECTRCQRNAECWKSQWTNWTDMHCEDCWKYYEQEAFSGIDSFSGLLPTGGPNYSGPCLDYLRPVGLVSITVFSAGKRPNDNDDNVGMVYTVGPNCGNINTKGKRDVDDMTKEQFLTVIETIAASIFTAVTIHNAEASAESLPSMDILRVCLYCGGVYKHDDATKLDVAKAIISGFLGSPGSELRWFCSSPDPDTAFASCMLDFAFDKDVFREAWLQLGLPVYDL